VVLEHKLIFRAPHQDQALYFTGFGVFEKSERPARTARNPATGATIQVPSSSVPKFRAGADFKALVNGEKPKK